MYCIPMSYCTVLPIITKKQSKPRVKKYVSIEMFNEMCDKLEKKIEELANIVDRQNTIIDSLKTCTVVNKEEKVTEPETIVDRVESEKTPYLKFRTEHFDSFKKMAKEKHPEVTDRRRLYQITVEIAQQTWKMLTPTQKSKYGHVETRCHVPKPLKLNLWNTHFSPDRAYGECYICTSQIHISNFEAGHIHPVAKGGKTHIDNLRPICGTCNKSMGTRNLEEFRLQYFG